MEIGIFEPVATVERQIEAVRTAHEQGFGHFFISQIFGLDALSTLAVVAHEVPEIRLGTAVVPIYRQHAMAMAQQALTVSQVSNGRLVLGIGLSHQVVVEGMWGMSYAKPFRDMREYLDALMPLLSGMDTSVSGESTTVRGRVEVDAPQPQVVLAALGPKMLELAGRLADGTVTWMVGPKTLASHIVPSINAAAESAGRDVPEVIVSLPTCVTDAPDAARARAAEEFVIYGQLPSYRAMLDREGAGGPQDVVIIGDASEVRERIQAVEAAGATHFIANEYGNSEERHATRETLQSLLS